MAFGFAALTPRSRNFSQAARGGNKATNAKATSSWPAFDPLLDATGKGKEDQRDDTLKVFAFLGKESQLLQVADRNVDLLENLMPEEIS